MEKINDLYIICETTQEDSLLNEIDYSINKTFGKVQLKIFTFTFLIILLNGLQMSALSAMLIPLEKYYGIQLSSLIKISLIFYLGFGIGSYGTAFLVKYKNRRFNVFLFLSVILFLNLTIGLIKSIVVFSICRLLVGFSIGVLVTMSNNLLCEYLPTRFRSFFLVIVWIGQPIGQMIPNLIMLFLMPEYDAEKIKMILTLFSLVTVIVIISSYYLFQDSPRKLILTGHEDRAIEIIETLNNTVINEHERKRIISEVKDGANKNMNENIKNLFNQKYFLTTVILSIMWILTHSCSYGLNIILSLVYNELGIEEDVTHDKVLMKVICTRLIHIPGYFIAGLLSEVRFLGRRKTMSIGYILMIFSLFLCVSLSEFHIWFGVYMMFQLIALSVCGSYTVEIYPTNVRELATGYLMFISRIGCCISQFFYTSLFKVDLFLPYYFTSGLMMLCLIASFMLPYETIGKALDVQY